MDASLEITSILDRVANGDSYAHEELLPLVYEELRRQATLQMANERVDHTLQATALVNEAYIRLLGANSPPSFESQRHFFAAAAQAMRRILIDHCRGKARRKRGGDRCRVELSEMGEQGPSQSIGPEELLELDDALQKLEQVDEEVARLVRLRLYAGVSVTEAAKLLGISRTAAYERWEYALCWFAVELGEAKAG